MAKKSKKSKKRATVPAMPSVDDIMRWEQGEMTEEETIEFFQGLIDSGMAWKLQGCYGRTAKALIEGGYCKAKTESLPESFEVSPGRVNRGGCY